MEEKWVFVGFEEFKGKKYAKLERVDAGMGQFSKQFKNISAEQMKALLDGPNLFELVEFAGLDPAKFA